MDASEALEILRRVGQVVSGDTEEVADPFGHAGLEVQHVGHRNQPGQTHAELEDQIVRLLQGRLARIQNRYDHTRDWRRRPGGFPIRPTERRALIRSVTRRGATAQVTGTIPALPASLCRLAGEGGAHTPPSAGASD